MSSLAGSIRRRRALEAVTTVVVLLAAAEAWFPFRPDLPITRRHAPTRAGEGTLVFDGAAALIAPRAPAWLAELPGADRLTVRVRVRSAGADQDGPARIVAISRDVYQMNLVVGQEDEDLIIRLRRPGSGLAGEPAIVVRGVFAEPAWRDIALQVDRRGASVEVDGAAAAHEPFEADALGPLASWDPTQLPSVGDAPGGDRAWRGEVARADVQGQDLLALPAADDLVAPSRLDRFWTLRPHDPAVVSVGRLAAFAVLGALVGLLRPSRRGVAALLAFPLALTAGKVLVAGRDPSLADVLIGTAGAVTGLLGATRAGRRWATRAGRRWASPGQE